jgi:iron complex outermembrane receptor protein
MSSLRWVLLGLVVPAPLQAAQLPEVVVVASALREAALATVPASVTVLDDADVRGASVQHFEELTQLIPNINWSGEGSRARYFQIRGTGELAQYEGAPNPSVGFLVDDIDLSDIGGVATTFDVGRIEVLRGPQGTRYGANALAGLIYVESAEPVAEPLMLVTATGGTDDTWALGGVISGPVAGLEDELTYRVAVQQYSSNGFRDNRYLHRDDTSNRDELTARAKVRWRPSARTEVQLTAFHVDLDDGYDDFALDNGYTTYSDKPGQDAQRTDAVALRASVSLNEAARLISITGVASSDIVYSFDADWGNDDFWSPYVYDFTQRFDRQRNTVSQEFRLVSSPDGRLLGADWVAGAYLLSLDETEQRRDTGICGASACGVEIVLDETPVSTDYEATNLAFFGELSRTLHGRTTLAAGLRWEQRAAEFGALFSPRDRMLGGDLSVTHQVREWASAWVRIARGYKAGGFNASLVGIDGGEDQLEFRPEYLWNYETGVRLASGDGRASASLSLFLQDRDDMQIKIPRQFVAGDPTTFLFSTANAEKGSTSGVELETHWEPSAPLALGASLGLLDTEIDRFSARPELEGRELAHAPRYTFALNATWRFGDGWFIRTDYTGKDAYAIDYCQVEDCNDPETSAYQLLDLRAGREWGGWSVEAWCRNVLDERYAVRGFYFGNEPPDFVPTLYTRLGDPRHAGVTLRYRFQ